MWLLLVPLAGLLGYLVYDKTHKASLPDAKKDAPVTPPSVITPGKVPGTGTIDGHGTGVLEPGAAMPPLASIPGTGILGPIPQPDPIAAAAAAAKVAQQKAQEQAAAAAAAQIAAQQNPNATVAQAALAAETLKLQMIDALNTPAGDRTPEQLALLSGLASLPVLSQDAK